MLVMNSLSRLTSSSLDPPSPCPLSPSSSSSFSSFSFNSSTTKPISIGAIQVLYPVENVAKGDDLGCVVNGSGSLDQVISLLELDWVDPKVTMITSAFRIGISVSEFLERVPILKADASLDLLIVEPCLPTETICPDWSPIEPPFFYMYSCLFKNLNISLPFDNFTMGVL